MNAIQEIYKNKIVAVIRAEDYAEAVEKANAMIEAGLKVFEITVEKEDMLPAIENFAKRPDITVMAGGIVTSMSAMSAINSGADVIVHVTTLAGGIGCIVAETVYKLYIAVQVPNDGQIL